MAQTFTLRDYQEEAAEQGRAYLMNPKMRGRNGLIIAPTGSGKSLVIAALATRLDGPCLVFQPSKEILEQNAAKLAHYGYKAAVFSASMGRREIGAITLATIGSVINHAKHFREIPYVLVDECHLMNAKGGMYTDFLEVMAKARVIGLTATPYRFASNSYGSQLRFLTRTVPRIFRDVVHVTQIPDLFARGYLTPLAYREVPILPRERLTLNTKGSDYTDASVQSLFGEVGFVGRLQAEVEGALAGGRKNVLVFTRFVEESRRLASVVPGCAVVTAETSPSERAYILDEFKRGRIRVVSNVGVIALGFDYPELECVILARPSISLALYYQQVGRIVRPHPTKPLAYVIDMVGLSRQFGKIEDLVLQPGGVTGAQWTINSGDRPLTNTYFEQMGTVTTTAAAAKAHRKRTFWAKRRKRVAS